MGAPAGAMTMSDLLLARADDPHPGLLFEDRSWTWAEVIAEGAMRARLALDLRGDTDEPFHIGLLLENTPDYVLWLAGAAFAGAAVVGINSTRRGSELARDIRHTDCRFLVTERASLHLLDSIDTGIDPSRVLVIDDPSYSEALRSYQGQPPPDVPAAHNGDTRLVLVFTSGSTGAPKAVVWGTGSMTRSAAGGIRTFGTTRDDINYNAMPMFHGNALKACWAPALATGATFATRRRFSASGFLPDIRRFNATYFNYVGRALSFVLAQPPSVLDRDHRLRLAFGTEASVPDRLAFEDRFGCPVMESYGSSENGISLLPSQGMPPAALGVAPPGQDIFVLDPDTMQECPRTELGPDGRVLTPAAIGELASRTGVFEGYYRNAEADAERLQRGLFRSGDLVYRGLDGVFYFAGRASDRLRVDSENLAAAPIERLLEKIDGVSAAVVYPVPDPRTGDQVMATVVPSVTGGFEPSKLVDLLADQPDLGTKWTPRFLRVLTDLPITPTEKVDRGKLRRWSWDSESDTEAGGPGELWWRRDKAGPYVPLTPADRAAIAEQFLAYHRGHLLAGVKP
jgi:fatty-acyl-CoA synthase